MGLAAETEAELAFLERHWPTTLPRGVIHADLFPDNVFFLGGKLSGLIDFYFACNDILAYDLAVCLNAWCFEKDHSFNLTKGRALISGYDAVRPLSAAEAEALPILARGAALRFMLTRLYDWLTVPDRQPGHEEGPAGVCPAHALPPERSRSAAEYGLDAADAGAMKAVEIFTDGACSGNPGPGGWGAMLRYNGATSELSGGEPEHHQQPHGTHGGDRGAQGAEGACQVDLHTDSEYVRNGITSWIHGWKRNGWKTADKKPVKNAELWQALDEARPPPPGDLALGQGPCRPRRERARRRAARQGMAPFKPGRAAVAIPTPDG